MSIRNTPAENSASGLPEASGTTAPKPLTSWGAEIDALARTKGGWPDSVVVYAMEALGDNDADEDHCHILYTGDVPIGVRENGRPKYPRGKAANPRKAVSTLREYRAALAKAGASS